MTVGSLIVKIESPAWLADDHSESRYSLGLLQPTWLGRCQVLDIVAASMVQSHVQDPITDIDPFTKPTDRRCAKQQIRCNRD